MIKKLQIVIYLTFFFGLFIFLLIFDLLLFWVFLVFVFSGVLCPFFSSCWNPLVSVKTVELTIIVLSYTLECRVALCILGDLLFPWELVSDRSCLRDLAFWFSVFELRFSFFFCLGMNFSAVYACSLADNHLRDILPLTISANVPHRQEPLMAW